MLNHTLTDREKQILILVAQGLTNKNISVRLFITEATVENHLSKIYKKLHISSRSQATAYAYQSGLITTGNDAKD